MKRCMIVDDSSVIRRVAKRILASPEMTVVEAAVGADALAMCAEALPDIIIVDSVLPDMQCEDFIRQVTLINPRRLPHILICLPEFDVGAIMRAKRAGAKGYILKPFTRPQLLEHLRQADGAENTPMHATARHAVGDQHAATAH